MSARLEVDLAALKANYQTYQNASRGGEVGAVVKADAYGLGAEAVATTLQAAGCCHFFVATAAEGVALRKHVGAAAIYVFEGTQSVAELLSGGLIPVINHESQLANWQPQRDLPCAIHVDTGMSRLGFASDFRTQDLANFNVAVLMTHLACADTPEHPLNTTQIERFDIVVKKLRQQFPAVLTSIGSSAGYLSGAAWQGDIGRPGIGLYGGNPFVDRPNPVAPVARFEGEVLQLRHLPVGCPVGYAASMVTERPTVMAVVGFGYADGVPRSLSNCGVMSVHGHRCPVIGRVSMDLTNVDVTDCLAAGVDVQPGDWVECFGACVSLDEAAGLAGTISYEILNRISARVTREYLAAG